MRDDQVAIAKHFMVRIVNEKIPKAWRWPVPKEYEAWIGGLSKDQLETYLNRLRVLTSGPADETSSELHREGAFISFGSYPLSEAPLRDRLFRVQGEATAYYALALWRTIEAEDIQNDLESRK